MVTETFDPDRLAIALGGSWCTMSDAADCDPDHQRIQRELETELHPDHPFFEVRLKVIAHDKGRDDIVCRHVDTPDRFSIVHLTWAGRPEIFSCPTIDADGPWHLIRRYVNPEEEE